MRSTTLADHQGSWQVDLSLGRALPGDQLLQHLHRRFAHFVGWLVDRGQRWVNQSCQGYIIESGQGDIFWNAQSSVSDGAHSA